MRVHAYMLLLCVLLCTAYQFRFRYTVSAS
jgi:hypothetical protein